MWIRFKRSERDKPIFELGPRRKPDDPFYDDFKRLAKALDELKQAVKETFVEYFIKIKKFIHNRNMIF